MKSKLLVIATILSMSMSMSAVASRNVTVVNHNKNSLSVNFTLCNHDKTFCTHIKSNQIAAIGTGNNSLHIIVPNNEHKYFTINSATELDSSGNTIAELNGPCELRYGFDSIILNDHGTSRLFCEQANLKS